MEPITRVVFGVMGADRLGVAGTEFITWVVFGVIGMFFRNGVVGAGVPGIFMLPGVGAL